MSIDDEALGALLEEADSRYSADELGKLLAGVASAPPNPRWFGLVAEEPGDALKAALEERLAVALMAENGLDEGIPSRDRLDALRAAMVERELNGYVVPHVDEHQGEYLPPQARRLSWLTGFSGSAGTAMVLEDAAAIFVDGRYTLQVRSEVDTELFEPLHVIEDPPHAWVGKRLSEGQRLGYDPWLHTLADTRRLEKACKDAGAELVAVDKNLVDVVWDNQPARPIGRVRIHPAEYAGRSSAEKREELGAKLAEDGIDAAVLTLPDAICWLLNVRGSDIPHNPLLLGFAILLDSGRVDLFVDERKLDDAVRAHLGDDVTIGPRSQLADTLEALAAQKARVLIDPSSAPRWFLDRLEGAAIVEGTDPCQLPKSCKNDVELEGMREAHRRDGSAMATFLAWLDTEAPIGELTEMQAADKLEACRAATGELLDLSFETISGAGPNGAIVHYSVSEESDRVLDRDSVYLVDSGAQYPDGTTDITRTVAVGAPTGEMRDRFTRVLKGHIGLGTAIFPAGTTGTQLDGFARRPLWEAGIDYDHGTGHGVGSYLCVHEGPQRISKLPNTTGLRPGMIISNEPGYYKAGGYGIRIENLVVVRALAEGEVPGAEREMLGFETITLCPIDRRLIDVELLTDDEIDWVDAYHAKVFEEIGPRVDEATRTWLEQATAPLAAD